jgi:hypothetical protein
MKYKFTAILFLLITISCAQKKVPADLKTGDIVFQTTESSQCKAVQLATHSIYSHCGMIYIINNKTYVYEAVGPVKLTPYEEWVQHGKGSKLVVKRLKNILPEESISKMKTVADKYKGKEYDFVFEWSDERIYCSELVYKIYMEGAGIAVGKVERLKDFDLSHPAVKEKLKERYGDKIPYEEMVVSPAGIFNSELLYTVFQN